MNYNTKTNYSEKLKDPRWQKKRLEVLKRDKWKCKLCGDKKSTLNVHHKKYSGEPWDSPNEDLITYCEHCHLLVEYDELNNSFPIIKVKKTRTHDGNTILFFTIRHKKANIYLYSLFVKTKEINTLIGFDTDFWNVIKKFHKKNLQVDYNDIIKNHQLN